MQYTNNRDAVGSLSVENQYAPEFADSRFSEPYEFWAMQHEWRAHFRLGREVSKTQFCSHQEAISNFLACNPGEANVIID